MMRLILLLMIIAGFLTLASCGESEGPEKLEDFDRSEQAFTIRVYTYKNTREVTQAYKDFRESKGLSFDGTERMGWAAWSVGEEINVCHIHVVKIDTVRDKQMEVWGHELAHCVYGSYHEQGVR